MNTASLAAQYAEKHSKGVVNGAVLTGRIVRWGSTAIMVAAMASNYHHQVTFIEGHVDYVTAHIAPIALDLLTVLCARVLASVVMHAVSKKAALRAIWFPVLASGTLSWMAPGDLIGKAVYAGMVGLILVAEYVSSHQKVNFKALEAAETEHQATPERRKMDPEKAAARAAKSAATREANRLAALSVGQRRAITRKRNSGVVDDGYELAQTETVASR